MVDLACGAQTRFQPTVQMLAAAHAQAPLEGVVLASPANPTGTMVDTAELTAIAQWCGEHGVRLVADEIYHGITYAPTQVPTAARFRGSGAIVVNSFSKYWAMTGWRLGWLILPDDLAARWMLWRATSRSARRPWPSTPGSQRCDRRGWPRQAQRHCLRRGPGPASGAVARARLERVAPADGAFYLYADVSSSGLDSVTWCGRLLEEAGVALTPGTDFDPVDGHQFVRLSFAAGIDVVRDAVDRIIAWQAS